MFKPSFCREMNNEYSKTKMNLVLFAVLGANLVNMKASNEKFWKVTYFWGFFKQPEYNFLYLGFITLPS